MSDYLSRIAARNLNLAEVVQPRLWSLFEPQPADGGQVFEEHFGYGGRDEIDETEQYAPTSISPSSPLHADRPADSALAEEGSTETARRKVVDPQTPIQNKPWPDLKETKAQERPIPERTENIAVAISSNSSEMASPGQNRSSYSAVAVNAGPSRTVSRKAVDAQPLTSEAILGRPLADPNNTETIPATTNNETDRIDSQSSSKKAPKKETTDKRQTASPTVTIKTEQPRTVRRKEAETIPSQLVPYPNKIKTIPETANGETRRIDSQSSSKKAPKKGFADQRQTASSTVTIKTETMGTVRRKEAETPPTTAETIPSQLVPYPNKTETIPETANGEIQINDTPSPSQKAPKKGSADQRQTAPPVVTAKTETVGIVRQKAAYSQPPSRETVVSSSRPDLDKTKSRPYPKMIEAIPATANNETERIDSQSSSQKVLKQTPSDQRQTAPPPAVTIRTETVGTVSRKAADSQSSSQKVLKQTLPDPRQTASPTVTAKTETIHRKAVDDQPRVPVSIRNRPRQESGEAKRQLGPEMAEKIVVTAKSEIEPPDLLQKEPPVAAVGSETARRVRQKGADGQPHASEPIKSRPWSDLERARRRPSRENAPYLEVITEGHPSSIETKLPSRPEIDRPSKVGIDGERRTVLGRVAADRDLLLASSSRAQAISPPEGTRFVAPTDSIKNHPRETKPTIQVKIGRVEVRAAAPTAPTSPPPRSATQSAPKLSLDEYLKQRDGGRL